MKHYFLIIFIGFIVGDNLSAMDHKDILKKLEESGVDWKNKNSDITGPFDWCINEYTCPKAIIYSAVKITFENIKIHLFTAQKQILEQYLKVEQKNRHKDILY